jgi:hypothetical protein
MRRGAVWLAVLLGLGLRSYHYLRQPPVWHDEAALIVNVLDKGYRELLGPLRFHEAAPPLFLWVERGVSRALGDGPAALRLPPFLASCAALLLLAFSARRLLPPAAAAWAVFLFACSEQLSWHACEAKPYAGDVLAATLLLAVHALRQGRAPAATLLLYAALAPPLLWLSYPAAFLFGGVLVALLPGVWRARSVAAWLAYALLALLVGGSFLALVLGPAAAQRDTAILGCWTNCFPDWGRPWSVPGWAALSTLEVGRYCCKPLGQALVPLALLGGVLLWRGRRGDLVALLGLPVGLALVAAGLHRYPYGGVRVMVFAAPALALLTAAGAAPALAALRNRWRPAALGLVGLLLLPAFSAAARLVRPWDVADNAAASALVHASLAPGDGVAGNDWTHLYYFRDLGDAFRWPEDASYPGPVGGRLWVVFSAETDAADRLAGARTLAPTGWRLCDRSDFSRVTVALFEPPAR